MHIQAHQGLGIAYLSVSRWDDAIASLQTALRLSPERIGAHYQIGRALLGKGELEAALEEFTREGDEEYRVKGTALAMHALGRQEEHEAALAELIERWGEQWPPEVAHVYAWIGDVDAALLWAEKELEEEGAFLPADALFYASISDDPRWAKFLERAGSSPDQLDAIEFQVTLPGR